MFLGCFFFFGLFVCLVFFCFVLFCFGGRGYEKKHTHILKIRTTKCQANLLVTGFSPVIFFFTFFLT